MKKVYPYLLRILLFSFAIFLLYLSLPRFGLEVGFLEPTGNDYQYQSTDWLDGQRQDNYGYLGETDIQLRFKYELFKRKFDVQTKDEVITIDGPLITFDGKTYDGLSDENLPDKFYKIAYTLSLLSYSEKSATYTRNIFFGITILVMWIYAKIIKMGRRYKIMLLLVLVFILYFVLRKYGFSLPFLPRFLFL